MKSDIVAEKLWIKSYLSGVNCSCMHGYHLPKMYYNVPISTVVDHPTN